MNRELPYIAAVILGAAWLPVGGSVLAPSRAAGFSLESAAQAYTGSGAAGMVDASGTTPQIQNNLRPIDPDSNLCAEGTRAIDQGRWADAVKIFSQVVSQHGDHADAAFYWKAYAENKLGQSKASQNSCAELRIGYPRSRWLDDCGALEVEIRAKSGKPAEIDPAQSDDVKLLALNLLLRQNEPRALAEIQEILKGDSSEELKKEVQFILGNHYSDTTHPQIVRISYVEGDVRIQRGDPTGKPNGAIWEKAVANLPVETGFSVATGAGRAEIEFENASTIYLGENSVMTFNDLHETAGVPFTELGLLSGTLSLYFRPYTAWEKLVVHTPTDDLISRYPDRTYARIEAFSDAVTITPLAGGDVRLPGVAKDAAVAGRTWTYLQGQLLDAEGEPDKQASSPWDQWVADRMSRRTAAVSALMAASGLSAPIPGLVEMNGQGRFFDCAPYGTCWEPADQSGEQENANTPLKRQQNRQPGFELAAYHPFAQNSPAAQASEAAPAARTVQPDVIDREYRFPCTPDALLYRMIKDAATGKYVRVSTQVVHDQPYAWAVCHAGSWIRHRRHYAWVVGGKRHHLSPVRWVKSGHQVGFVPLHPYDVKGQPAINAKHEFFAVSGKEQIVVAPVKPDPERPIEYLKIPPKEFRTAPMRPLAQTEAPRMEAHAFPNAPGNKSTASRAAIPIRFDAKTLSFNVPKEEVRGGRTTTVYSPMTNHSGSLQAHGASFAGDNGSHSSGNASSGGGYHGGSGGSSGSGFHSSTGSSASSSHAGGASSTSSSSSSSSSASAASSSASHH